MWVHGYGILMDNQIRVCTAACQNPILYPPKLEVECHCILARNQVYLSSHGWLLTVDTVLATDVGLLLKLTWGTYTQYCRLSTRLYGPGVTDHIRDRGVNGYGYGNLVSK